MSLVREKGDVVVLRGGSEKALLAVGFGVIALSCLILAVRTGPPVTHVLGSILFLAVGLLWVRGMKAEVRAERDLLVLRTPFRTHRIQWSAVVGADVVPTNGNRIFAIVRVTLRSGKRIKVDGAARKWSNAHNESSDVGKMVAEINRRVLEGTAVALAEPRSE
jgi:Bacterial PH domain